MADDSQTKFVFTYTGDLVTKKEEYWNNKTTVGGTYVYTYNSSNKLATEVYDQPSNAYKYEKIYTYNTDGTITEIENKISTTGVKTLSKTTIYSFSAGNMTKSVETSGSTITTTIFEYGTKNVITGISPDNVKQSVNNVIKETKSYNSGGSSEVTTYEYEYHTNGYPTKITKKTGAETSIEEYTY